MNQTNEYQSCHTADPSTTSEFIFTLLALRDLALFIFPTTKSQICMAIATLLPILTYPFHPTSDKGYCLFLTPCLQFACFHILNAAFSCYRASSHGPVGAPINPWVLPLAIFAILAQGVPGNKRSKPESYSKAAQWAWCVAIHFFYRFLESYVFDNSPTYSFVSAAALGFGYYESCTTPVMELLSRVMPRKIAAWHWLPENGAAEDFEPEWSQFLIYVVYLSVPVLSFIALPSGTFSRDGGRVQ